MSKEIALTIVLVALSTVLKICSVVALCQDHHTDEPEHDHQEITFMVKKESSKQRFSKA